MTPWVGCFQRMRASAPRMAPSSEVEDGLVEEEELVVGDGGVEVRLEGQPVDGRRLHGRLEQDRAVPAHGLGLVEGHVGVPQQVLGRLPRAGGDADAGRDRDGEVLVAGHPERGAEGIPDPLGDELRGRTRGRSPRPAPRTRRPPSRPTVSSARIIDTKRSATAWRSRSPASWPRESLASLKLSRSMKYAATAWPDRRDRASICSARSRISCRLARPVSGSWTARWANRASNSFRSVMSLMLAT